MLKSYLMAEECKNNLRKFSFISHIDRNLNICIINKLLLKAANTQC